MKQNNIKQLIMVVVLVTILTSLFAVFSLSNNLVSNSNQNNSISNNNPNNDNSINFESNSNDTQLNTADSSGGASALKTWLAGDQGGIFTLTQDDTWDTAGSYDLKAGSTITSAEKSGGGYYKLILNPSNSISKGGNFEYGILVNHNNGTIKNLVLETGKDFTAILTNDGYASGGGICGVNKSGAVIENVEITIKHVIGTSGTGGNWNHTTTGAIAGTNSGTIRNCTVNFNNGNIQARAHSAWSGRSSSHAGGIAGSAWDGSILNCKINGISVADNKTIVAWSSTGLGATTVYGNVGVIVGTRRNYQHDSDAAESGHYPTINGVIFTGSIVLQNDTKSDKGGNRYAIGRNAVNGAGLNTSNIYFSDKPTLNENNSVTWTYVKEYNKTEFKSLRFDGDNLQADISCTANQIPFTVVGEPTYKTVTNADVGKTTDFTQAGDRTVTWVKKNSALTFSNEDKGTVKYLNYNNIGSKIESTYGNSFDSSIPTKQSVFSGLTNFNSGQAYFEWKAKNKSNPNDIVGISSLVNVGEYNIYIDSTDNNTYIASTDNKLLYLDATNKEVVYVPVIQNLEREELSISKRVLNFAVGDEGFEYKYLYSGNTVELPKVVVSGDISPTTNTFTQRSNGHNISTWSNISSPANGVTPQGISQIFDIGSSVAKVLFTDKKIRNGQLDSTWTQVGSYKLIIYLNDTDYNNYEILNSGQKVQSVEITININNLPLQFQWITQNTNEYNPNGITFTGARLYSDDGTNFVLFENKNTADVESFGYNNLVGGLTYREYSTTHNDVTYKLSDKYQYNSMYTDTIDTLDNSWKNAGKYTLTLTFDNVQDFDPEATVFGVQGKDYESYSKANGVITVTRTCYVQKTKVGLDFKLSDELVRKYWDTTTVDGIIYYDFILPKSMYNNQTAFNTKVESIIGEIKPLLEYYGNVSGINNDIIGKGINNISINIDNSYQNSGSYGDYYKYDATFVLSNDNKVNYKTDSYLPLVSDGLGSTRQEITFRFLWAEEKTITATNESHFINLINARYYSQNGLTTIKLASDITINNQYNNPALQSYKTIDGDNYTINYIYSAPSLGVNSYNATNVIGTEWYGFGNIVGINYGIIKNIVVNLGGSNSEISALNGYNTAFGLITGINKGSLTDIKVLLDVKVSINYSNSNMLAVGGIVGITENGTINNCEININSQNINKNIGKGIVAKNVGTNSLLALGGAFGIVSGGSINDIVVKAVSNINGSSLYNSGIYYEYAQGTTDNDFANLTNIQVYAGGVFGIINIGASIGGAGVLKNMFGNTTINTVDYADDKYSISNIYSLIAGDLNQAYFTGYIGLASEYNFDNWVFYHKEIIGDGEANSGIRAFYGTDTATDSFSMHYLSLANRIMSIFGRTNNTTYDIGSTIIGMGLNDNGYGNAGYLFVSSFDVSQGIVTINVGLPSTDQISFAQNAQNKIEFLTQDSFESSIDNNTITITINTTNFSNNEYNNWANYRINYYVNIKNIAYNSDKYSFNHSELLNFINGYGIANFGLSQGAKYGVLSGDIDLNTKQASMTRVMNSRKTLDGNGYSIISARSQTASYATGAIEDGSIVIPNNAKFGSGMLGVAELVSINYGTIKNIKIIINTGAYPHAVGFNTTNNYYDGIDTFGIGILAGINAGVVNNCNIEILNTYSVNVLTNKTTTNYIGALAGYNIGTIESSNTKINQEYKAITVASSTNYFGALIGYNAGFLISMSNEEINKVSINLGADKHIGIAGQGNNYVGGAVGKSIGIVDNIQVEFLSANINHISLNSDAVTGIGYLGGVVGVASAVVSNPYLNGQNPSISRLHITSTNSTARLQIKSPNAKLGGVFGLLDLTYYGYYNALTNEYSYSISEIANTIKITSSTTASTNVTAIANTYQLLTNTGDVAKGYISGQTDGFDSQYSAYYLDNILFFNVDNYLTPLLTSSSIVESGTPTGHSTIAMSALGKGTLNNGSIRGIAGVYLSDYANPTKYVDNKNSNRASVNRFLSGYSLEKTIQNDKETWNIKVTITNPSSSTIQIGRDDEYYQMSINWDDKPNKSTENPNKSYVMSNIATLNARDIISNIKYNEIDTQTPIGSNTLVCGQLQIHVNYAMSSYNLPAEGFSLNKDNADSYELMKFINSNLGASTADRDILVAGAKYLALTNNFSMDMKSDATRILAKGKILFGNDKYIKNTWGINASEPYYGGDGDGVNENSTIVGINDNKTEIKYYKNKDSSIQVRAGSTFIAINYGTIKGLNVGIQVNEFKSGSNRQRQAHRFAVGTGTSFPTSLAYGIMVGVNYGNIEGSTAINKTASSGVITSGLSASAEMYVGVLSGINMGVINNSNANLELSNNPHDVRPAYNNLDGKVDGKTKFTEYGVFGANIFLSAVGGLAGLNGGLYKGQRVGEIYDSNTNFVQDDNYPIERAAMLNNDCGSQIKVLGGLVGINNGGTLDSLIINGNGKLKINNKHLEKSSESYLAAVVGVTNMSVIVDSNGDINGGDTHGISLQGGSLKFDLMGSFEVVPSESGAEVKYRSTIRKIFNNFEGHFIRMGGTVGDSYERKFYYGIITAYAYLNNAINKQAQDFVQMEEVLWSSAYNTSIPTFSNTTDLTAKNDHLDGTDMRNLTTLSVFGKYNATINSDYANHTTPFTGGAININIKDINFNWSNGGLTITSKISSSNLTRPVVGVNEPNLTMLTGDNIEETLTVATPENKTAQFTNYPNIEGLVTTYVFRSKNNGVWWYRPTTFGVNINDLDKFYRPVYSTTLGNVIEGSLIQDSIPKYNLGNGITIQSDNASPIMFENSLYYSWSGDDGSKWYQVTEDGQATDSFRQVTQSTTWINYEEEAMQAGVLVLIVENKIEDINYEGRPKKVIPNNISNGYTSGLDGSNYYITLSSGYLSKLGYYHTIGQDPAIGAIDKFAINIEFELLVVKITTESQLEQFVSGIGADEYTHSGTNIAIKYSQALDAELENNLVLNQTTWNESNSAWVLDAGKTLNGKGKKINLNINKMGITSIATSSTVAGDNLPMSGSAITAYAAFIPIIRGTIKNINFEYSGQMGIYNGDVNTPWTNNSTLFYGIITGYLSGTIDSCTLTMKEDSFIYSNKKSTGTSNNAELTSTAIGGYAGIVSNKGVISNSSLDMREGASIIAKQAGNYSGKRIGDVKAWAGGFAGYLGDGANDLNRSTIYNATITGHEKSIISATAPIRVANNANYEYATKATIAGGIVGSNANNTIKDANNNGVAYNYKDYKGLIDGVIFNWNGLVVNKEWVGANSVDNYYVRSGVAVGTSMGSTAADTNSKNIFNVLPSYNITEAQKTYFGINNDVINASLKVGSTTHTVNIGRKNSTSENVVLTGGADSYANKNVRGYADTKTINIYKLDEDSTASEYDGGNVNLQSFTSQTELKDLLSWSGKDRSAYLRLNLVASNDASSIIWNVHLKGAEFATVEGQNQIKDIIDINKITTKSYYETANHISVVTQHNNQQFVIPRDNGKNTSIYFSTGRAYTVRANTDYYAALPVSFFEGGATTINYYAHTPLKYDSFTRADAVGVELVNAANQVVRFNSALYDKVIGALPKTIDGYTTEQINQQNIDLTQVGEYEIIYTLKGDINNPNANVNKDARVIFFPTTPQYNESAGVILEEYNINAVIAPRTLDIYTMYKTYDGTKGMFNNNNIVNFLLPKETDQIMGVTTYYHKENDGSLTITYQKQVNDNTENHVEYLYFEGEYKDKNVSNENNVRLLSSGVFSFNGLRKPINSENFEFINVKTNTLARANANFIPKVNNEDKDKDTKYTNYSIKGGTNFKYYSKEDYEETDLDGTAYRIEGEEGSTQYIIITATILPYSLALSNIYKNYDGTTGLYNNDNLIQFGVGGNHYAGTLAYDGQNSGVIHIEFNIKDSRNTSSTTEIIEENIQLSGSFDYENIIKGGNSIYFDTKNELTYYMNMGSAENPNIKQFTVLALGNQNGQINESNYTISLDSDRIYEETVGDKKYIVAKAIILPKLVDIDSTSKIYDGTNSLNYDNFVLVGADIDETILSTLNPLGVYENANAGNDKTLVMNAYELVHTTIGGVTTTYYILNGNGVGDEWAGNYAIVYDSSRYLYFNHIVDNNNGLLSIKTQAGKYVIEKLGIDDKTNNVAIKSIIGDIENSNRIKESTWGENNSKSLGEFNFAISATYTINLSIKVKKLDYNKSDFHSKFVAKMSISGKILSNNGSSDGSWEGNLVFLSRGDEDGDEIWLNFYLTTPSAISSNIAVHNAGVDKLVNVTFSGEYGNNYKYNSEVAKYTITKQKVGVNNITISTLNPLNAIYGESTPNFNGLGINDNIVIAIKDSYSNDTITNSYITIGTTGYGSGMSENPTEVGAYVAYAKTFDTTNSNYEIDISKIINVTNGGGNYGLYIIPQDITISSISKVYDGTTGFYYYRNGQNQNGQDIATIAATSVEGFNPLGNFGSANVMQNGAVNIKYQEFKYFDTSGKEQTRYRIYSQNSDNDSNGTLSNYAINVAPTGGYIQLNVGNIIPYSLASTNVSNVQLEQLINNTNIASGKTFEYRALSYYLVYSYVLAISGVENTSIQLLFSVYQDEDTQQTNILGVSNIGIGVGVYKIKVVGVQNDTNGNFNFGSDIEINEEIIIYQQQINSNNIYIRGNNLSKTYDKTADMSLYNTFEINLYGADNELLLDYQATTMNAYRQDDNVNVGNTYAYYSGITGFNSDNYALSDTAGIRVVSDFDTKQWATYSIVPKAVTLDRIIKDYDGNTNTQGAFVSWNSGSLIYGDTLIPKVVFNSANAGARNLTFDMVAFSYLDGITSTTVYRIVQSDDEVSNYCFVGAESTSFTVVGKGYIVPIVLTLNKVTKTYDGTVNLGDSTITLNGTTINNDIVTIAGTYSKADVTYSGNNIVGNNFNVTGQKFSYVDSNNTTQHLWQLSTNGNYALTATASASGDSISVAGVGVINPREITITSVSKVYDGGSLVGTSATIVYSGGLSGANPKPAMSFGNVYSATNINDNRHAGQGKPIAVNTVLRDSFNVLVENNGKTGGIDWSGNYYVSQSVFSNIGTITPYQITQQDIFNNVSIAQSYGVDGNITKLLSGTLSFEYIFGSIFGATVSINLWKNSEDNIQLNSQFLRQDGKDINEVGSLIYSVDGLIQSTYSSNYEIAPNISKTINIVAQNITFNSGTIAYVNNANKTVLDSYGDYSARQNILTLVSKYVGVGHIFVDKNGNDISEYINITNIKVGKDSTFINYNSATKLDINNYALHVEISITNSNYALQSFIYTNYVVDGGYVVIPKEIRISSVEKTYDGTNAVNSNTIISYIEGYNPLESTIINGNNIVFGQVNATEGSANTDIIIQVEQVLEDRNGVIYYGIVGASNYYIAQESQNSTITYSGIGKINKKELNNNNFVDFGFLISEDLVKFGNQIEYGLSRSYNYNSINGSINVGENAVGTNYNNITAKLFNINDTISLTIEFKKNSSTVVTIQDAGDYTISFGIESNNYKLNSNIVFNQTISKQKVDSQGLQVTMDTKTAIYGSNNFDKPSIESWSDLGVKIVDKYDENSSYIFTKNQISTMQLLFTKNGENASSTISPDNGLYVGGYQVWIQQISGASDNYDFDNINLSNVVINGEGSLTYYIIPAELNITKIEKTYDGTNSFGMAVFSYNGLIGADSGLKIAGYYGSRNANATSSGNKISENIIFVAYNNATILNVDYSLVVDSDGRSTNYYILGETSSSNNGQSYYEFGNIGIIKRYVIDNQATIQIGVKGLVDNDSIIAETTKNIEYISGNPIQTVDFVYGNGYIYSNGKFILTTIKINENGLLHIDDIINLTFSANNATNASDTEYAINIVNVDSQNYELNLTTIGNIKINKQTIAPTNLSMDKYINAVIGNEFDFNTAIKNNLKIEMTDRYSQGSINSDIVGLGNSTIVYYDSQGQVDNLDKLGGYKIKIVPNNIVTDNYVLETNNDFFVKVGSDEVVCYIIPIYIDINEVVKEYDGTNTFNSQTMIKGNNQTLELGFIPKGNFGNANVVYNNITKKFGDAKFFVKSFTYYDENGEPVTVAVLKASDDSLSHYSVSTSTTIADQDYEINYEGIGVILPKEVTITSVTKSYDGQKTISYSITSQDNITTIVSSIGSNFKPTGEYSTESAGAGIDVLFDSIAMEHDGIYYLLKNSDNTYNYYVSGNEENYANGKFRYEGIGEIKKYGFGVDNDSEIKIDLANALKNFMFYANGSATDKIDNNGSGEYRSIYNYIASGTSGTIQLNKGTESEYKHQIGNMVFYLLYPNDKDGFSCDITFKNSNNETVSSIKDSGIYTAYITIESNNYARTTTLIGTITINQQEIVDNNKMSLVTNGGDFSSVYSGQKIESIDLASMNGSSIKVKGKDGETVIISTSGLGSATFVGYESGIVNVGEYSMRVALNGAEGDNYIIKNSYTIKVVDSQDNDKKYSITPKLISFDTPITKYYDTTSLIYIDGVNGERLIFDCGESYKNVDTYAITSLTTANIVKIVNLANWEGAYNQTTSISNYSLPSSFNLEVVIQRLNVDGVYQGSLIRSYNDNNIANLLIALIESQEAMRAILNTQLMDIYQNESDVSQRIEGIVTTIIGGINTDINSIDILGQIENFDNYFEYTDGKYSSKLKEYTEIDLPIQVSITNYNIAISQESKLILVHHLINENGQLIISNFNDFMMLMDSLDQEINPYSTFHYVVTRNINGKSKIIRPIALSGSIQSSDEEVGYTISNFVVQNSGSDNITSIFKSNTATINNIRFVNVIFDRLDIDTDNNSVDIQLGVTNNSEQEGGVAQVDKVFVEGTIATKYPDKYTDSNSNIKVSNVGGEQQSDNMIMVKVGKNVKLDNIFVAKNQDGQMVYQDFDSIITNQDLYPDLDWKKGILDNIITDNIIRNTQLVYEESELESGDFKIVTDNFRKYYAWSIICPWLTPTVGTDSTGLVS